MTKLGQHTCIVVEYLKLLKGLIIPSLGTGGPYPQQRWSEET